MVQCAALPYLVSQGSLEHPLLPLMGIKLSAKRGAAHQECNSSTTPRGKDHDFFLNEYNLPTNSIYFPPGPSPPNMPENSFEFICFMRVCKPPIPPICFSICGGSTLLICCAFMLRDIALMSPFLGIFSPFILLQILASLLNSSSISCTSRTLRPDPLATLYMRDSVINFGFVLSNSARGADNTSQKNVQTLAYQNQRFAYYRQKQI